MMSNLPVTITSAELVSAVNGMIDSYKEAKINSEIQKTERERIIQEARVFIKKCEGETEVKIADIKKESETNLALIKLMEKVIIQPNLEEKSIQLCEMFLNNLR